MDNFFEEEHEYAEEKPSHVVNSMRQMLQDAVKMEALYSDRSIRFFPISDDIH